MAGQDPTPSKTNCNSIDQIDFQNLNDMTFNIPPSNSNGYSIGFWMFIENGSNSGDNLLNIIVSDTMMISMAYDTQISNICNINILQNPSITTKLLLTELNTEMTSLGGNNLSVKAKFDVDKSKIWFYTRCAFSYDFGTFYSKLQIKSDSFGEATDPSMKFPSYWNGIELDNHFRKFYFNSGDTRTLKFNNIQNFSNSKSVFIRNLYFFKDYIPKSMNIQYL